MDKYEVIIYWSKEDNAFIAEAPELPGCIAHGETHSKALTNLKSAMKLENALNFTEHLGDSSEPVRRLLEDHKKKDSGKTLSPLKLVAGTGFEPATSGL